MTSVEERLQQLLDGELDAAELAEDPTLASLADRLYGIKIKSVAPKKKRDFAEPAQPSAPLPATDMMIEVITQQTPDVKLVDAKYEACGQRMLSLWTLDGKFMDAGC